MSVRVLILSDVVLGHRAAIVNTRVMVNGSERWSDRRTLERGDVQGALDEQNTEARAWLALSMRGSPEFQVPPCAACGVGETLSSIATDGDGRPVCAACAGECPHKMTRRGADAPRLHGSWRTELCVSCGAFRTHGHDPGRSNLSEWRPASEYAEWTAPRSLDE